jgi:DNA-binding sugar fermentation-stimulating protein
MADVVKFRPHHERDLELADYLYDGIKKGLKVLVYNSKVTRDEIELKDQGELLAKSY